MIQKSCISPTLCPLNNTYLPALSQVIAAEGEQKASRALREAAEIVSESPAAIQLRYLQVTNQSHCTGPTPPPGVGPTTHETVDFTVDLFFRHSIPYRLRRIQPSSSLFQLTLLKASWVHLHRGRRHSAAALSPHCRRLRHNSYCYIM